jgi:uncharacterized protein involved in exopolysaccharide biosynthesis
MSASLDDASTRSPAAGSGEVSVGDLVRIIWRERWMMLIAIGVCAAGAAVIAFLLPKKYEAEILLLPVTSQSGSSALGGVGSAVSQLGGVASLVGLSGLGSNSAKVEAVATLQSELLTERFIHDNNLLPILYKRRWDATAMRWNVTDPDKVPTLWKGSRYFKEQVRAISEDNKTGLVAMSITWTDPKSAADWANGLVRLTNEYVRDRAIEQADRNVAYLRAEIQGTNDVELRNVIYSLIQSEIKKQMIARGEVEYALKVIDPAAVPEKPSSPIKWLWVLGGALVGAGLSLGAGIVRSSHQ